ncbi:MAG: hypothetical protein ACR2QC_10435, partial [Gammaproteobacteria bacterium]
TDEECQTAFDNTAYMYVDYREGSEHCDDNVVASDCPEAFRFVAAVAGKPATCVARVATDCGTGEEFDAASDGVGGVCRGQLADDCEAPDSYYVVATQSCRNPRTARECQELGEREEPPEVWVLITPADAADPNVCRLPVDETECGLALGNLYWEATGGPSGTGECRPRVLADCTSERRVLLGSGACGLADRNSGCALIGAELNEDLVFELEAEQEDAAERDGDNCRLRVQADCTPLGLIKGNLGCRAPVSQTECDAIPDADFGGYAFNQGNNPGAADDSCRRPETDADCQARGRSEAQVFDGDVSTLCRARVQGDCSLQRMVLLAGGEGCRFPRDRDDCTLVEAGSFFVENAAGIDADNECTVPQDNADCAAIHGAGYIYDDDVTEADSVDCRLLTAVDCAFELRSLSGTACANAGGQGECNTIGTVLRTAIATDSRGYTGSGQLVYDAAEDPTCREMNAGDCASGQVFKDGTCTVPTVQADCTPFGLFFDNTTDPDECRLPGGDGECNTVFGNAQPIFDENEDDRCRPFGQAECTAMTPAQVYDPTTGTCEKPGAAQCSLLNMVAREVAGPEGEVCRPPGNTEECRRAFSFQYVFDDTTPPGMCRQVTSQICYTMGGLITSRFAGCVHPDGGDEGDTQCRNVGLGLNPVLDLVRHSGLGICTEVTEQDCIERGQVIGMSASTVGEERVMRVACVPPSEETCRAVGLVLLVLDETAVRCVEYENDAACKTALGSNYGLVGVTRGGRTLDICLEDCATGEVRIGAFAACGLPESPAGCRAAHDARYTYDPEVGCRLLRKADCDAQLLFFDTTTGLCRSSNAPDPDAVPPDECKTIQEDLIYDPFEPGNCRTPGNTQTCRLQGQVYNEDNGMCRNPLNTMECQLGRTDPLFR